MSAPDPASDRPTTSAPHPFRNKLSILLPFLAGLAFFILGYNVSNWYYLGYAALGVVLGRLTYGTRYAPGIGDAYFALVGWLFTWFAVVSCWFKPWRDKNLIEILRS